MLATPSTREGLPLLRFILVLGSFAPLFLLWAIRGLPLFDDHLFIPVALTLAIVPNLLLCLRILTAKNNGERFDLRVTHADDHRDHLLVYLFAMLLPLYAIPLDTPREFYAALAALAFILYLFWHLNLHYMNLLFALFNYRVYSLRPDSPGPFDGKRPLILITRRTHLSPGEDLRALRLSNSIYFEESQS